MKKNIIWYALGLGALYFLMKGKGKGTSTKAGGATEDAGPAVGPDLGTPASSGPVNVIEVGTPTGSGPVVSYSGGGVNPTATNTEVLNFG